MFAYKDEVFADWKPYWVSFVLLKKSDSTVHLRLFYVSLIGEKFIL